MNTLKKQTPSTQFIQQLQTDGKAWYLTHPKAGELTSGERITLKEMSTAKSLQNLQGLDESRLTIEMAFKGTNVRTALVCDEAPTRAALIGMLTGCVKYIDANKTLTEPEHIAMAVNELVELFPTFTLEDWRLCLHMMKKEHFGNYWERLKVAQFVNCFTKYDQLKQPVIQTIRENERKDAERMQQEAMRHLQPEYATEINPVAARVHPADWMAGTNRLTYTERDEMQKRQKQGNK